jgi:hypothetical protein
MISFAPVLFQIPPPLAAERLPVTDPPMMEQYDELIIPLTPLVSMLHVFSQRLSALTRPELLLVLIEQLISESLPEL